MSILQEIVNHKHHELIGLMESRPIELLQEQARMRKAVPPFVKSLQKSPMGLIAEVKHMSPSVGVIRTPFDPVQIAESYARGGAQAVSVLMDKKYFDGGEKDFLAVRRSISLPMLYKEFVIEPWQVWHAAAAGASAVLLIVSVLRPAKLRELIGICHQAKMEPLVEVHDVDELMVGLDAGAETIGINNRNLKTFTVSLQTTVDVKEKAPSGTFLISESGIRNAADVAFLKEHEISAILVGEHLLKKPDLVEAVGDLMGRVWPSS